MVSTSFGELSKSRFNNFDALRFLFATLVIAAHCKITIAPGRADTLGTFEPGGIVFTGVGPLCVNGFFMISGFLILQSFMNSRGLSDYLWKRLLRIYPAFLVVLLFCAFIVAPLAGVDLRIYLTSPTLFKFLRPLILGSNYILPNAFAHLSRNDVDGPIWTIRFEIMCYLGLAVLGLLGWFKRPALITCLFAITAIVFTLQYFNIPSHWKMVYPVVGDVKQILRLALFFLAGMVVYLYRDKIPHSTLLLAVSLAVLCLYRWLPLTITMPIFGTYALFWVAFCRAIPLQNFAKYGDFSYGLYLYGWPMEQLILQSFGRELTKLHALAIPIVFVPTFLGALVLAATSWRFIEKPALSLKKRFSAIPKPVGYQVRPV